MLTKKYISHFIILYISRCSECYPYDGRNVLRIMQEMDKEFTAVVLLFLVLYLLIFSRSRIILLFLDLFK